MLLRKERKGGREGGIKEGRQWEGKVMKLSKYPEILIPKSIEIIVYTVPILQLYHNLLAF